MENKNYKISITVNADATKAFNNICNVDEWWCRDIDGNTNHLNDVFTVHFGDTFVDFKITSFGPDSKITWNVTNCYLPWLKDKTEWNNTNVVWNISPKENETLITMEHEGLTPAVECYNGCEQGWNLYAGESLRSLINEGKGTPQMPKEKSTELA